MIYEIKRDDWNFIVKTYDNLSKDLFIWVDAHTLEVDENIVRFALLKNGFETILKLNKIEFVKLENE